MNQPTTIVFWQNVISIHQAPLIRALAMHPTVRVVVIAFSEIPKERRAMGWEFADYGNAELISPTEVESVAALVEQFADAQAHIFSGVGVYIKVSTALKLLSRRRHGTLLAATEPWDTRGVAGVLRIARLWARTLAAVGQLDGVLLCGRRAAVQLRRIPWFKRVPFYEFGYFVDSSGPHETVEKLDSCELIYVGQLTEWKAPLDLLRALAKVDRIDWRLRIIGEGVLRRQVEEAIARHGLGNRVELLGTRSNAETRAAIATSDALVLPSRYDGWGAVVNEALMDGTRVIVSDAAGASDLIVDKRLGARFPAGRVDDLAAALRAILDSPRTSQVRNQVSSWASATVSPEVVAVYVLTLIASVPDPVTPPWRVADVLQGG